MVWSDPARRHSPAISLGRLLPPLSVGLGPPFRIRASRRGAAHFAVSALCCHARAELWLSNDKEPRRRHIRRQRHDSAIPIPTHLPTASAGSAERCAAMVGAAQAQAPVAQPLNVTDLPAGGCVARLHASPRSDRAHLVAQQQRHDDCLLGVKRNRGPGRWPGRAAVRTGKLFPDRHWHTRSQCDRSLLLAQCLGGGVQVASVNWLPGARPIRSLSPVARSTRLVDRSTAHP